MFRYPFGSNLRVLFERQTQISLVATYCNFGRAFDILKQFYNTKQFTTEKYEQTYEPKLIVEGGEYYQSSVVGYKYHSRSFHPYYTSYEECANYLADVIKDEFKDHLFMPMCYLYRNAIELGLKRIIIEDSSTIDTEKALKQYLIAEMEKGALKSLENDFVKVTYVAPSERESIDKDKLKEKYPDIYEEYRKVSPVGASVRIKIK
jgi:uncharacterized protein YutD